MNCKVKAVIKLSEGELEELKRIVLKGDAQFALKKLTKINKAIEDFIEPH